MKYIERECITVESYSLRKNNKITEFLRSKKYKRLSDARSVAVSCGVGATDLSSSPAVSYEDALFELECGNGTPEEVIVESHSQTETAINGDNATQEGNKERSGDKTVWKRGFFNKHTRSRSTGYILGTPGITPEPNLGNLTVSELLRWVLMNEACAQVDYTDVFLLTYRLFTRAENVLETIMQDTKHPDSQKRGIRTQKRVVIFIKKWLALYPDDFQNNSRLCIELRSFFTIVTWDDPTKMLQCKPLLNTLWAANCSTPIDARPACSNGYLKLNRVREDLLDFSAAEIARQITEQDLREFQLLKRLDLLNIGTSLKFKFYVNRASKIAEWVVTSIVKCEKDKLRCSVIKKFVKLCKEFYRLGNYNGLNAVLTGLYYPNITGLHAPWTEVGEKCVSTLEKTNKAIVRHKQCLLSNNPEDCANDDVLLPSIGAFVCHMNELGAKVGTMTPAPTVNFSVVKKIYTCVMNMERYQNKDPKQLFKR